MQRNDRQIDVIQNDLNGAEQTRRKARWISVAVIAAVSATLAGAGWTMASRQADAQPAVAKNFTPAQATKAAPLPGVSATSTPKTQASSVSQNAQAFSIAIGDLGYNPSTITASASRPITLKVAKGEGCAAGFLIKKLGIDADNSSKSVTLALGKLPKGTYRYTCGMEMVEGKLVVD